MSSCILLFLFLSLSFSFSLSINRFSAEAAPEYLYHCCPNTSLFATDSAYRSKLHALWFQKKKLHAIVSSLSAAAPHSVNGFANATTGRNPPHRAYGLFLCRGDIDTSTCSRCVAIAKRSILERCPHQPVSAIWFDQCMLRFSNRAIFSAMEPLPNRVLHNNRSVADPTRFMRLLGETLNHIAARASAGGPGKKVAAAEANFTRSQKLHALGQCTPYLTASDCFRCLQFGIANLSQGKEGGRFVAPSCILRYELYSFYDASALPSPPYPASPPTPTGTKAQSNKRIAIVILVAVVSLVLLCLLCNCWCRRGSKGENVSKVAKGSPAPRQETGSTAAVAVLSVNSTQNGLTQFTFEAIRAATGNFYREKLGSGGFGEVFKVKLSTGTPGAVKRLNQGSKQGAKESEKQGAKEFESEVASLAKVNHRNLVELVGFCLRGAERLLVYEFAENGSLDQILFDPERSRNLNWSTRCQIACGIAKGMRYLHEESPLKIIHRDLKPSNILLGKEMIPKISDFGLARIFGDDQSWEITYKLVGTRGYMAPEYVMSGQFSTKSDVYSFGVLLLELVSGRKHSSFNLDQGGDIVVHAWEKLNAGTWREMVDPAVGDAYSVDQVISCLKTGVRCAQREPDRRPTMVAVLADLSSHPNTLELPAREYLFFGGTGTPIDPGLSQASGSSVLPLATDGPSPESGSEEEFPQPYYAS